MAEEPGAEFFKQAMALQDQGRALEAVAAYDQALAVSPDSAIIHYNRGFSLMQVGRFDEALGAYETCVQLKPDWSDAQFNRASILRQQGRLPEALAGYDAALAINPRLMGAWNNRAGILRQLGANEDALASLDRALALDHNNVSAHYNRGLLLMALHRFLDAQSAFEMTLKLAPGNADAIAMLAACAVRLCDWRLLGALTPRLISETAAGRSTTQPLLMLSLTDDPALQRKCAEAATTRFLADAPRDKAPLWRGERYNHERLRVAYVSTDFVDHPVGAQIVGLLEAHDRARFEIIGIFLAGDDGSALHRRIVAACDQFHVVWNKGNEEIAELLRALEVDIVVDLNGMTDGWRPGALVRRPAPVQATFLGYAGTTGADFIDYIIADSEVAPFSAHNNFSEKLVHLPCFWPTDGARQAPPAPPGRAACALPEDAFVFCSFGAVRKINAEMFDVWMRLLTAAPDAVLWLKRDKDAVMQNLRAAAGARGINPDRLIWAERVDSFDMHLARHANADLFLDTFPYGGHVTASDALWAGLPVLTRRGASFASRVAASMLRALDLPELITDNAADYQALALALTKDRARLSALRARLGENRFTQALFDAPRFARSIESAYQEMNAIATRGEDRRAFAVKP